jgi:hypothetical protein
MGCDPSSVRRASRLQVPQSADASHKRIDLQALGACLCQRGRKCPPRQLVKAERRNDLLRVPAERARRCLGTPRESSSRSGLVRTLSGGVPFDVYVPRGACFTPLGGI